MTFQQDDPNATQAISAMPSAQADALNATLMTQAVKCPVCEADNTSLDVYCRDCGFLLAEAPVMNEGVEVEPTGRRLVSLDGLREFPLRAGENTVGREDSDVLLADQSVSRKHAVVVVADTGITVKDLGSTNGTKVAGARLGANEVRRIAPGDEIIFGTVTLRYESEVEEPAPEDAAPLVEVDGETVEQPHEGAAPARLVSADGALVYYLKPGVTKIGRREDVNDIALPDPFCSSSHAQITEQDGSYTFEDMGSTNGSLVNGVKMAAGDVRTLISGDELTLGKTTLRFEVIQDD